MRKNEVKAKLKAGEVAIGAFISFPSATIAEFCGYLGFDFIIVDSEHGPMNEETCENMLRAADVAGTVPIIRVPLNIPQLILKYLDRGALGIQIPQINSKEDALTAVRSVKYYPEGMRGLAGPRSALYGLNMSLNEYVKLANQETMLITHVENTKGVDNLGEMLTVEGIDVFFIGPVDLSQSLGYPGQITEPVVEKTIDKIIEQVRGAGRAVGIYAGSVDFAKKYIDKGVQYIATGTTGLLAKASREFLKELGR